MNQLSEHYDEKNENFYWQFLYKQNHKFKLNIMSTIHFVSVRI